MKKKILIDATPLADYVDGLSIYIIHLVKNLPEQSHEYFEYSVLINPRFIPADFEELENEGKITLIRKNIAPIGPKRDWSMFWFLKKYEPEFDLIHITSNNYPLALKKGICTIHDVTFKTGMFDSPKYTFKLAVTYMDLIIRNCLKKAFAVITVSNSTRLELIKWFKLDEKTAGKINVVNQGWEHLEFYKGGIEAPCDTSIPKEKNYLFYLGTLRVHKNISNLLEAFEIAKKDIPSNIMLAISGFNTLLKEKDVALFKTINNKEERAFFTGYLSNACVEEYYKNADAFILPSLSEGFGLPVLEAFYYNVPVLCSNTTSLPEVAGKGAIYFNPYDPMDIAKAIVKFYNDPALGSSIKEEGKKQLLKFSWKKNAAETVNQYKKALGII